MFFKKWYLMVLAAAAAAGMQITVEAESIRIAFIDTGISTKYIDPAHVAEGKNYVFPERDTDDREGHGTATAGMVLGSEKLGIEGSFSEAVAVPLVTYDLYPSGVVKNGGIEAMCQAIYDAVDVFGCSVINMSMGIAGESDELREAVKYADLNGVTVVSAVGNDNEEFPDLSYYPAGYSTVIGVGSSCEDNPAEFSQRNNVFLLSDGINLKTVSMKNEERYELRNGTSYSCAYVSGLCAEIMSRSENITPAGVRAILAASCTDILSDGKDKSSGWGIIYSDHRSDVPITRGMMMSFLYILDGEPEVEDIVFEDVDKDAYYSKAVSWALSSGVATGTGENKFSPDENITREQIAAIFERYARFKGIETDQTGDLSKFNDLENVSEWALENVSWAVGAGLINGKEGNMLDPKGNTTREQAAAILERFMIEFSIN